MLEFSDQGCTPSWRNSSNNSSGNLNDTNPSSYRCVSYNGTDSKNATIALPQSSYSANTNTSNLPQFCQKRVPGFEKNTTFDVVEDVGMDSPNWVDDPGCCVVVNLTAVGGGMLLDYG
jgi:hypothetical protein